MIRLKYRDIFGKTRSTYLRTLSLLILFCFRLVSRLPLGTQAKTVTLEKIWNETIKIYVGKDTLLFHDATYLLEYRARTLLTKEPETIKWLDNMSPGKTFWDVGANIGIYSIYAAKFKSTSVFAFEPSFRNLDFLQRNIASNQCQDQVAIVPIALGQENGNVQLFMDKNFLTWGGAHNSASWPTSQDGSPMLNFEVSQQLISTGDKLAEFFQLPSPDYLKIDVDGLELKVLQGMRNLLRNVHSILVECDIRNKSSRIEIQEFLEELGFMRELYDGNESENQIWNNVSIVKECKIS